jgi:cell division protein FtsW (lipid II flippase)
MTKERGGSLIFLGAGIYGFIFSVGLPLGRWNEPGPAVFPLTLSILLCASGLYWFTHGKKKRDNKDVAVQEPFYCKFFTPIKIVGLTAAFVLALEHLGFLLTATAYLFVLFFWVSRYRLWVSAALAIAFGAGSWLFFGRLLSTPLPGGFLSL